MNAGDQHSVDFTIDPSKAGDLVVTIPDEEAKDKPERMLSLIPAGLELPGGIRHHYMFDVAEVKLDQKQVNVKGVPAGKYRVIRGKSEADVEIFAGKDSPVNLVRMADKK